MTTTSTFNITNLTNSTTFTGFGTNVWIYSWVAPSLGTTINTVYGDTTLGNNATNANFIRLWFSIHKSDPTSSNPPSTTGSYADYVAYLNSIKSIDPYLFPVTNDPVKTATIPVLIVPDMPYVFQYPNPSNPSYLALNPQYAEYFANYLAAIAGYYVAYMPTYPKYQIIYIEVGNEPDNGDSDKYIDPTTYQVVVNQLRQTLDANGLQNVLIVGAGISHMDNVTDNYTNPAITGTTNAAYSVHAWISNNDVNNEGGQIYMQTYFDQWLSDTVGNPNGKPVYVTEYADDALTYHGKTWPACNGVCTCPYATTAYPTTSAPNVADSFAYGARTYYNTIALINNGVNVPVFWELADVQLNNTNPPTFTGGYSLIDLNGNMTNAYYALRPLLELIPNGSFTIQPTATQASNDTYEVVFVNTQTPNQIIVTACLVNCNAASSGHSYRSVTKTRKTQIQGIPSNYSLSSYTALQYEGSFNTSNPATQGQMAATNTVNNVTVSITKQSNYWEFLTSLVTDASLTVQMVFTPS